MALSKFGVRVVGELRKGQVAHAVGQHFRFQGAALNARPRQGDAENAVSLPDDAQGDFGAFFAANIFNGIIEGEPLNVLPLTSTI